MVGSEHLDTPRKARVKGTIEFLEAHDISFAKKDVFEFNGVSERTGRRVVADDCDRTRHNDPNKSDERGKKRKATDEAIDKIKDLFEKEGFEAKRLHPSEISAAAGIDKMHPSTIRRALKSRKLNKRIAQVVDFVPEEQAESRKKWATTAYHHRPLPESWDVVYFSDEVHFGYDDEGKVYIYRYPGTRHDPDNLQEKKEPDEEDQKKLHAWGAIGIGYKSPLVFYDIPTNNNGKITQKCYEEEILEKYVKPLLEEGHTFILEEDNDSGHGPRGHNRISKWKEKHGLLHYFNHPQSPDLSPIENAWGLLKAKMRRYSLWDVDALKQAALDYWDEIPQEAIDKLIYTMPKRLKDCIKLKGKKTGY